VRVLVVSGIWPPDVGGPATHAPEVAEGLLARGHEVSALTTADAQPASTPYPIDWVSRTLPAGVRHAAVARKVAELSRHVDVVYATSMVGRSAFAVRAPLVVKVAGDPAFERSRRRGWYDGTLSEFQDASVGLVPQALRTLRTATLRRARTLVCPSDFLRRIVVTWGVEAEHVVVVPNATPPLPELPPRRAPARPTLVFAGRLTPAKSLPTAFEAVARAATDVELLVVGDGELRAELERAAGPRVRFLGAQPRHVVLEQLAAADAALLSSSWENFPHTLVEALAVGTPVLATRVGGVPEIVEDGVNGLLVPPHDPAALAGAIDRFFGDADLRGRLQQDAAPSVQRFAPDAVLDRLESVLADAARTLRV
jgi:glycosyltransferase involved in cell wall biosynthesis